MSLLTFVPMVYMVIEHGLKKKKKKKKKRKKNNNKKKRKKNKKKKNKQKKKKKKKKKKKRKKTKKKRKTTHDLSLQVELAINYHISMIYDAICGFITMNIFISP